LNIQKYNDVPLIPFLLMQIFFSTLYNSTLFQIFGEIKGQLFILFLWLLSYVLFLKDNIYKDIFSKMAPFRFEVAMLIAFVIVNIFYMFMEMGDGIYKQLIYSLIILVSYTVVIITLKDNYRQYIQTVIIIIIVIGSISTYVIPTIYANPYIARNYLPSEGELMWYGSWSFFMPYAIAMPCLIVVSFKQRPLLKLILLSFCFIIGIMILVSTFLASSALLILGCVSLLLFIMKKKTIKFVMILLLTLLLLLSIQDFFNIPQLEFLKYKVSRLFYTDTIIYGSHEPRLRLLLFLQSLHTFLENPFFGVGVWSEESLGYSTIGMHSGLDALAEYGLLGIIPFMVFIALSFKRLIVAMKVYPDEILHYARFITFLLFIIGAMVNPILFSTSIWTLVFILSLAPIENNPPNRGY